MEYHFISLFHNNSNYNVLCQDKRITEFYIIKNFHFLSNNFHLTILIAKLFGFSVGGGGEAQAKYCQKCYFIKLYLSYKARN